MEFFDQVFLGFSTAVVFFTALAIIFEFEE